MEQSVFSLIHFKRILCNLRKLSFRAMHCFRDDWISETEVSLVSLQIGSYERNHESGMILLNTM